MPELKFNNLDGRKRVDPLVYPGRFVENLIETDFSVWSNNDIPNTGDGDLADSTTNTTNDTCTISTVTPGTGRAFKGRTVTDFFVVDIFSLMRDKTTAFNLDALYNVGDGLHPNTAGSVMIANAINAVLTQIDNVVDK